MNTFNIILDANSLTSNEYNISGILYIRIDDYLFPCDDWNDLCLSILIMWGENISKIKHKNEAVILFYFMDGDYYVSFKVKKGIAVLSLFENGNQIQSKYNCLVKDIINEWVNAAKMLNTKMHNDIYYINNRDSKKLEKLIKRVETINVDKLISY